MAVLGNSRKCYISSSSSGSKTWLTGEQSNSFDLSANLVEVSDKEDSWQKFIAGIKGATASVTAFADESDNEQLALINALTAGSSVYVVIGNEDQEGWSFEALVASVSETNDNGSVATRTFSLTATGEVTSNVG